MADERRLFLLTREARSDRDGFELVYWGASPEGPVRVSLTGHEARFYVERGTETHAGRREPSALTTLDGRPVDALAFRDRRAMIAEADRLARRGTPGWEADVKPADRFLMERRITAGCVARGELRVRDGYAEMIDPALEVAEVEPSLRVASFDVEAEGPDAELISVAIVCEGEERCFVRGAGPAIDGVRYFADEASALRAFLACVAALDPDVLIGWNVIEFDVDYLERRCRRRNVPFRLGRAGGVARVLNADRSSVPAVAIVPGRVVLDGIATMRAATWSFERWSLEHVAQELLGRGKKIERGADGDRLAEILRMYREELPKLVEYNLEDCRLVRDVFAKAQVLEFAVERQRLTGVTMDRRASAVSAFDYLYLPRLHAKGRVAPSTPAGREGETSPGGFVMESAPGLYDDVLVLDFKSLYPSLIRTFLVDPLGLAVGLHEEGAVPGFEGARFSRTEHILPELIESLWAARDRAKRIGDAALSRAIKIQMNSFYGVLGTPACRFFDPRLATSITRRGHEVLKRTRAAIEARGHRVIYGDTDSLFVLLDAMLVERVKGAEACRARGAELVRELNLEWEERIASEHGLPSALELQLETCFSRFLMPTMRGSELGSKKRYAGLDGDRLVIKGLEAIRTDWTPLARRFQRELIQRVFDGQPYDAWIRELTAALFAGALDEELVYRKRLRRDLRDYERNVPPHVAAARQLETPGRDVEYVITTRGPQPVEKRSAPLDHQHYLERQLAPAAEVVLPLLGDDFLRIGGRQLSLF